MIEIPFGNGMDYGLKCGGKKRYEQSTVHSAAF